MAQRPNHEGSRLSRVLARAQQLAEEVRETAERVHQHAQEAHRLTGVARQQAERGRELSKTGRADARVVVDWLKWQVNTAAKGKHRVSGNKKT